MKSSILAKMLAKSHKFWGLGLVCLGLLLGNNPSYGQTRLTSEQNSVIETKLQQIKRKHQANFLNRNNKQDSAYQGQFKSGYIPVENQDLRFFEQVFAESGAFDILAQGLNEIFMLPTDINIVLAECGQINAFYDPSQQVIVMCYELIADYAQMTYQYATSDEEWITSTVSGTLFVFFHELGHALIHVLDLPAVGREEDEVDQLATVIAAEIASEGEGIGEQMAIVPALQYMNSAENGDSSNLPFWDEHSLDQQRYYNIICMLYGSNPSKYSTIATLARLPGSRAQRCPAEYEKVRNSWMRLLEPYTKL